MEKISSIVPQSKRVKSVDLAQAQPVRPGMPSFGRPVGATTPVIKSEMTTAERAVLEHQKIRDSRSALDRMPQVVQEMSNKFFMQKTIPAPLKPIEDIDLRPPEVTTRFNGELSINPSELDYIYKTEGAEDVDEDFDLLLASSTSEELEEYVPKGSYIDVSA